MNAFVIIREIEEEDVRRIKTSAESFCKRHNIRFDSEYDGNVQQKTLLATIAITATMKMICGACGSSAFAVP